MDYNLFFKNEKNKFILYITMILIGIVLMISSTKLGEINTVKEVIKRGGMDNITRSAYIHISMIKYVCIGFILSLIGGLGVLKQK